MRLLVALVVMVASAGCIVASWLTWISLPNDTGGVFRLSGWGVISGASQVAGENVNDALAGFSSFRPGALAVVIGGLSLLAAFGIALVARGRLPHRIPAALLTLCGLGGMAWGIVRGVAPGDLDGTYADAHGQIASGLGAWLTAGCSLILFAAAVVIFAGVLDPPPPIRHRGIQPR